jgi:hypothetical protein
VHRRLQKAPGPIPVCSLYHALGREATILRNIYELQHMGV